MYRDGYFIAWYILENMRVAPACCRFFCFCALVCLIGAFPAHANSNGTLRVAFTFQGTVPVVDISVTLYSPDRVRQTKADKQGKIEFTALPFQIYELEVTSVSFADVSLHNIQITSSEPVTLNIPLDRWTDYAKPSCPPPLVIDLVSDSGQYAAYEERIGKPNLGGTIWHVYTGKPLKGATVTLVRFEAPQVAVSRAIADSNGIFEFEDIEPGKYSVAVSYNGILEKPSDFHFWVSRENLTRLGRIEFGISQGEDNCGGTVTIYEIRHDETSPPPDFSIPFPLPLPPPSNPSRRYKK